MSLKAKIFVQFQNMTQSRWNQLNICYNKQFENIIKEYNFSTFADWLRLILSWLKQLLSGHQLKKGAVWIEWKKYFYYARWLDRSWISTNTNGTSLGFMVPSGVMKMMIFFPVVTQRDCKLGILFSERVESFFHLWLNNKNTIKYSICIWFIMTYAVKKS